RTTEFTSGCSDVPHSTPSKRIWKGCPVGMLGIEVHAVIQRVGADGQATLDGLRFAPGKIFCSLSMKNFTPRTRQPGVYCFETAPQPPLSKHHRACNKGRGQSSWFDCRSRQLS